LPTPTPPPPRPWTHLQIHLRHPRPSTLTTSSTVILPPIPKLDTDSSSKPSPIPPPGLVSQLSKLVAQKVFEAMERAGIVSSELNGKGKERATDTSGSSDAHTPVNLPHQSSNEQPNTHMMLLVQVIKEMKQDGQDGQLNRYLLLRTENPL